MLPVLCNHSGLHNVISKRASAQTHFFPIIAKVTNEYLYYQLNIFFAEFEHLTCYFPYTHAGP